MNRRTFLAAVAALPLVKVMPEPMPLEGGTIIDGEFVPLRNLVRFRLWINGELRWNVLRKAGERIYLPFSLTELGRCYQYEETPLHA